MVKDLKQKYLKGDRVRAGDIIGTFDSEVIAANGLDDTTMVIITNTMDYAEVDSNRNWFSYE